MLRISISPDDPNPKVRLEGKFMQPWIGEVRTAVAEARARGRARLDLEGLTFADQSAVEFIHQLGAAGVAVEGASPFISELLANHARHVR